METCGCIGRGEVPSSISQLRISHDQTTELCEPRAPAPEGPTSLPWVESEEPVSPSVKWGSYFQLHSPPVVKKELSSARAFKRRLPSRVPERLVPSGPVALNWF